MKLKYLKIVLVIILVLAVANYVSNGIWLPKNGIVIDATSGNPVNKAYVVGYSIGETNGFATRVCLNAESTTSNKNGKFTIPGWFFTGNREYSDNFYHSIIIYKEGYTYSTKPVEDGLIRKTYYLKRDDRTGSARLDDINKQGRHQCAHGYRLGISARNTSEMRKAMYLEGQQHSSRSESDIRILEWLEYSYGWSSVYSDSLRKASTRDLEKEIQKFLDGV